jgi:hypothetical protein
VLLTATLAGGIWAIEAQANINYWHRVSGWGSSCGSAIEDVGVLPGCVTAHYQNYITTGDPGCYWVMDHAEGPMPHPTNSGRWQFKVWMELEGTIINPPPSSCSGTSVSVWEFSNTCSQINAEFDASLGACLDNGLHFDPVNDCELGNPCSPANRNKKEAIVDYEAPGISFSRTWRSKIAPSVAFGGQQTVEGGRFPRVCREPLHAISLEAVNT